MGLTTSGSDTGMFPNDPQMVLFSGKIRKGENVYLHKVPFNGPDGKPQFVQGGNSREFHSIPGVKGIKPVEIKAVPVNKYLNLIRQATPADLELQKKYMKQMMGQKQAEIDALRAKIDAERDKRSIKNDGFNLEEELNKLNDGWNRERTGNWNGSWEIELLNDPKYKATVKSPNAEFAVDKLRKSGATGFKNAKDSELKVRPGKYSAEENTDIDEGWKQKLAGAALAGAAAFGGGHQANAASVDQASVTPSVSQAQPARKFAADPRQQALMYLQFHTGLFDPATLPKMMAITPNLTLAVQPSTIDPSQSGHEQILASLAAANKKLPKELQASWDQLKKIGGVGDTIALTGEPHPDKYNPAVDPTGNFKESFNLEEELQKLDDAKYHGRTVPLNKPMKGDVKKSKVYVKDPKTGNIKKVNFGDKNMRIKKNLPGHRKSFRARHHCDTNPGPKTKARYWSCRAW
jgi:hypothetical protein